MSLRGRRDESLPPVLGEDRTGGQQTTDANLTEEESMQNPIIENWVQFMHLQKLYGYLPGMDETLLARLFGLDPRTTGS